MFPGLIYGTSWIHSPIYFYEQFKCLSPQPRTITNYLSLTTRDQAYGSNHRVPLDYDDDDGGARRYHIHLGGPRNQPRLAPSRS
jgi:hypothetical protein